MCIHAFLFVTGQHMKSTLRTHSHEDPPSVDHQHQHTSTSRKKKNHPATPDTITQTHTSDKKRGSERNGEGNGMGRDRTHTYTHAQTHRRTDARAEANTCEMSFCSTVEMKSSCGVSHCSSVPWSSDRSMHPPQIGSLNIILFTFHSSIHAEKCLTSCHIWA